MPRTIFDEIEDFERKLGLPSGFYETLLSGDDWSFVIKLNALFEAACTQVLTRRLHAPELSNALAQLDLAHTKYGKVALLATLGAVYPEQVTILRALAELRNLLVHNITNVGFSFTTYLAGLDSNQVKVFARNFGRGIKPEVRIAGKNIQSAKFVRQNPKLAIWFTAAEILACLYLEFEVAELKLRTLAQAELSRLQALSLGPYLSQQ